MRAYTEDAVLCNLNSRGAMLSFLTSIKEFAVGTVGGFFSWALDGVHYGGWAGLIVGGIIGLSTGNPAMILLGGLGGAVGGAAMGGLGGLMFGGISEVWDHYQAPEGSGKAAPAKPVAPAKPAMVVDQYKAKYDAKASAEADAKAALEKKDETPSTVVEGGGTLLPSGPAPEGRTR